MGNLSSIYHERFDKLFSLTESHNKAVFLDKLIFWWQVSTYTLNDGRIWFTRKLTDIANELRISPRSVSRYLDEFENMGFIERRCKLSASNKENHFSVTKRLYIHITDKLFRALEIQHQPTNSTQDKICNFFAHDGNIEKDNLSESIYKDNDHNLVNNSTVSKADIVNNFLKPLGKGADSLASEADITFPIERQIGERITNRLKNYIKGMLTNVQIQHNVAISDPNKLFAEVIFSTTQENQWQGLSNPHHRVNIIAKLLRENKWKTPKGFYNHWDVGQMFRKKEEAQLQQAYKLKFMGCEMAPGLQSHSAYKEPSHSFVFINKNQYNQNTEDLKNKSLLCDVNMKLLSEESYLRTLKQQNKFSADDVINVVANNIARLKLEKNNLQALLVGIADSA